MQQPEPLLPAAVKPRSSGTGRGLRTAAAAASDDRGFIHQGAWQVHTWHKLAALVKGCLLVIAQAQATTKSSNHAAIGPLPSENMLQRTTQTTHTHTQRHTGGPCTAFTD